MRINPIIKKNDVELLLACKNGNDEDVKKLIQEGADPKAIIIRDIPYSTALFIAIHNRKLSTVKLLIENHVEVNINPVETAVKIDNKLVYTHPLHQAIQLHEPNIVEELIKAGVNINYNFEKRFETPLSFALKQKCFRSAIKLINNGARENLDINSVQDYALATEKLLLIIKNFLKISFEFAKQGNGLSAMFYDGSFKEVSDFIENNCTKEQTDKLERLMVGRI